MTANCWLRRISDLFGDGKEKTDFKNIKSHVLQCSNFKKHHKQQTLLLQLPLKDVMFIYACLLSPPPSTKASDKIQSHPKVMLPAKNCASLGKISKLLTASPVGNAASCGKRQFLHTSGNLRHCSCIPAHHMLSKALWESYSPQAQCMNFVRLSSWDNRFLGKPLVSHFWLSHIKCRCHSSSSWLQTASRYGWITLKK